MIGCSCPVCTSNDPHNKRLRPSALLTINGKQLLIDAGPDLRFQALHHHINHLDGVLVTHAHFDHIAGLDELRIYSRSPVNKKIPLLVSHATFSDLKQRYQYLFREKSEGISMTAQLEFHILEKRSGHCQFLDIPLSYMTYEQGGMEVNGFRFGTFAYVSDLSIYHESIFKELEGVKILVMSALCDRKSKMHLSIEEAIAFSRRVGATVTYFTHINHEIDHSARERTLPPGIHLGYDGLRLTLGSI